MFSSSAILGFFLKLSAIACESFTGKALKAVFSFIKSAFSGSVFGHAARFFIKTEESKADSNFYKTMDRAKNLCLARAKFIKKLSKTSIFMRIADTSFILKTENLLYVFVFAAFIVPHEKWNNLFALAAAVLIMILYAAGVVGKRGFGENVYGIWFSFVLFVIATVTSVLTSVYISDSIRVFMFFLTAFILCLMTYGTVTSLKRLKNLSMAIYWTVFVTGIAAIIQNRLGIAADPALTDMTLNYSIPGRAFATLGNPNNYAEFLLIFLPFAFAFAASCEKEKKLMLICGLAVPFAALLLTYSRSGWLGFAAMVFVFLAFYNWRVLPALIFLGICAVPLLPHSVLQRILTIGNLKDSSIAYRLQIWPGVLRMLRFFWYRGTGLGPLAFREIYPTYAIIWARPAPHAHMLPLEIWAEMGILGLLSFVFLTGGLLRRSYRCAVKEENKNLKAYHIAALSSMAGIFTMGLFEYVWFYPRVLFAFFIVVGIIMATTKLSESKG